MLVCGGVDLLHFNTCYLHYIIYIYSFYMYLEGLLGVIVLLVIYVFSYRILKIFLVCLTLVICFFTCAGSFSSRYFAAP